MHVAIVVCLFVAQTPAPPAWKFAVGDTFLLERTGISEEIITIKERPLKQTAKNKMLIRFEVGEVKGNAITLKATFDNVEVQSATEQAKFEIKLLERMKGASLFLEVTPRGKIVRLIGYDDLAARMAEKKAELEKVVRQLWPEALLVQEFAEMLAVVPEKAVGKGERWEQTGTFVVPPLGVFKTTETKTHTEIDRAGHHHFAGITTGVYQLPNPPSDLLRVVGGELRLEKTKYECSFDPERGRLTRISKKFEIVGDATVEINGNRTEVNVSIRREMTTRLK